MKSKLINELEVLSKKIEQNTATLTDYKRYEQILLEGGLSHDYIFHSLSQAGFDTWEEFVEARKRKQRKSDDLESGLIGGLVGIGLGLLLIGIFSGDKK